jgi:peptide deformylase
MINEEQNSILTIDTTGTSVPVSDFAQAEILKIDTGALGAAEKTVPLFSLVKDTDPILRKSPSIFDFSNPPMDPSWLALRLFETMFEKKGYGLSANQVGLPYRVFVAGTKDQRQIFFNPEIIEQAEEKTLDVEGCLSFPLLFVKVYRSTWIKIRSQSGDGSWRSDTFSGLTARIIQHEMDHMEGKTFLDRIPKLSAQIAREKQKKNLKKMERHGAKLRNATISLPITEIKQDFNKNQQSTIIINERKSDTYAEDNKQETI